ncbi:MAG TPA: division/cell wall cluster transcriptional repressor MraZ [Candidatus Desulfobacillus sp.]|nr:division/cell wall cluster transcriptional repressor MraZ [Candidatus Desulfobacillus sp.]
MYQGAAALNLDAKGRLAVPSRHRESLSAAAAGTLVLTAHPHRCLLIYPLPAWEPIRDKVLQAPSLEQQSALLKRLLVGFAREEELDASGRVLIAPELRQYAGLEKEVWLVGQGNHFELWSAAGWAQQQEAIFALGDKLLPPGLETLAL